MPHFIDRAKPGVIAVTPKGKRFTNEGNSYHDFVQEMVKACKGEPEVSAWLLCDHQALRNYGLGCVAPFPLPIGRHLQKRLPEARRHRRRAGRSRSASLPPCLQATVDEFNRDAANGRGSGVRQGQQGLQPLPGRRAGHAESVRRTAGARARSTRSSWSSATSAPSPDWSPTRRLACWTLHGKPIKGLYAVGNDAASVMGGNYPGAGITLGPALTFGYVAGCSWPRRRQRSKRSCKVEQPRARGRSTAHA